MRQVREKVFFGYPENLNNDLKTFLMLQILRRFPGHEIATLSGHHEALYKRWEKKPYRSGMDYIYLLLLPTCARGIFLPFPDGRWDIRSYDSAKNLLRNGKEVFEITHTDTIAQILSLHPSMRLSSNEDKERLRKPNGEPRPYSRP